MAPWAVELRPPFKFKKLWRPQESNLSMKTAEVRGCGYALAHQPIKNKAEA